MRMVKIGRDLILQHGFRASELNILQNEIKKFIGERNITTNIFRIQAYESIMSGYICNEFVDFILNSRGWLEYINLFSSNKYEMNDKIILKSFQ